MKNTIKILLSFIAILFCVSCNSGFFTGNWDYKFTNNSSKDISFMIDNDDTIYTLEAGKDIVINKNHNDNVSLLNNPRVYVEESFKDSYGYYNFYDLPAYTKHVQNLTNTDILLYEINGYIGDTYGEFVEVPADGTATFTLYTTNPSYSAVTKDTHAVINISNLAFY